MKQTLKWQKYVTAGMLALGMIVVVGAALLFFFKPNKANTPQSDAAPAIQQIQNSSNALKYEPVVVMLDGRLISANGETPDGAKISFPALQLNKPITVDGDPKDELNSETERDVKLLHLVLNEQGWKTFRSLTGRSVSVKGTLFHSSTGGHQTKVLITVAAISESENSQATQAVQSDRAMASRAKDAKPPSATSAAFVGAWKCNTPNHLEYEYFPDETFVLHVIPNPSMELLSFGHFRVQGGVLYVTETATKFLRASFGPTSWAIAAKGSTVVQSNYRTIEFAIRSVSRSQLALRQIRMVNWDGIDKIEWPDDGGEPMTCVARGGSSSQLAQERASVPAELR